MSATGYISRVLIATTLLCCAAVLHAQSSVPPASPQRRSDPVVTMSAGIPFILDNRIVIGPAATVIGLGLSGKSPHLEWTVIGGRMLVVPGIGVVFGIETGVNISASGDGTYAGVVLSRFGAGAGEGIVTLGGRAGMRPVRGRGVRYEARVDLASEDATFFLAYVSIGYDVGGR